MKDRSFYFNERYMKENRIYIDFYRNNFDFNEDFISFDNVLLKTKFLDKIGISWNFLYSDYRASSMLGRFLNGFLRNSDIKFSKPNMERELIFSANFSTS